MVEKDHHNFNRRSYLKSLGAAGVAGLAGCTSSDGGNDGGGETNSGTTAGDSGSGTDTITLGAIYPLSGALASSGQDLKAGVELAVELINNEHPDVDLPLAGSEGIPNLDGAKLEVQFSDHKSDPARGKQLAQRFIDQVGVTGLLGCYNSSVTKTASQTAEQLGTPMVNGTSTSPALTQRGFDWFWRTTPHDKFFTKNIFQLMDGLQQGKGPGVDSVSHDAVNDVALVTENTEFGSLVHKYLKQWAGEMGYNVVADVTYSHGTSSATSEVQTVVGSDPDAVLHASYVSDAILFMKGYQSRDFSPNILWGDDAGFINPDFYGSLGDAANGVLTRTVFTPKITKSKPVAKTVNELFNEQAGHDLTGASARSFTGLQTWAHILNEAGSTDPGAIQETANQIQIPGDSLIMPWDGIQFDDTGQNTRGSGLIAQIQDGQYEIIWPFELATADMIYPY